MSRKDTYHDSVKRALLKDGWQITHDPLPITYEGASVSTDLGAEKVTALDGVRIAVEIIAVEIKDFDGWSLISEFEKALGQYRLYRALLKRNEPDRVVFLACGKTFTILSFNCLPFKSLPVMTTFASSFLMKRERRLCNG